MNATFPPPKGPARPDQLGESSLGAAPYQLDVVIARDDHQQATRRDQPSECAKHRVVAAGDAFETRGRTRGRRVGAHPKVTLDEQQVDEVAEHEQADPCAASGSGRRVPEEPDELLVIPEHLLGIGDARARVDPRAEVQVTDDEDLLDVGGLIREVAKEHVLH